MWAMWLTDINVQWGINLNLRKDEILGQENIRTMGLWLQQGSVREGTALSGKSEGTEFLSSHIHTQN